MNSEKMKKCKEAASQENYLIQKGNSSYLEKEEVHHLIRRLSGLRKNIN